MPINPTFVIVNSAAISQTIVDQWQALAVEALSRWGALLAGDANLVVRLEFLETTPSGRAQGGVGTVIATGAPDGGVAFEGTPGWQLRHGSNPNGGDTDILVQVAKDYLLNELFLDPTPATANDIPADRTDGLTVMLHEIGHALGFIGYYNEAGNTFPGGSMSPYDTRLAFANGEVFFDGPNIREVLGAAAPLTDNNYTHYGDSSAHPSDGDPLTGLMNGVVFYRGFRYTIEDIDLAFLADIGLGTVRNDVFDQTWLDVIRGGAGVDTFRGDYTGFGAPVTFDASGAIWTAPGLDLHEIERADLTLSSAPDSFIGSANDDTVAGGFHHDTLIGAAGDDILRGDGGDDQIFGGFGADRAEGGAGDDFIRTGPDNDTLLGGDGADTLGASNRTDLLRGGDGEDLLLGSNGNDRLFGDFGNDTMLGGNGRDTLYGGDGSDRLVGGDGTDTASYAEDSGSVRASLLSGVGFTGAAHGDVFIDIENFIGSAFQDYLTGDDNENRIEGGEGDDSLRGQGGDDILNGQQGDDTLVGGDGADQFWFRDGEGSDRINDFDPASGDLIRLFSFGAAFDTFAEVLAASTNAGANLTIDFGGGQTLTLLGINKADLAADDFVFG